MTKNDLKTGMWVRESRGTLYMIIVIEGSPFMVNPNAWLPVEKFPIINDSGWSITGVYKYNFKELAGSLQYNTWKDQIDDGIAFTKIWPIIVKETIKIGEITYDKSEFEQAVKNLKPINK